jgi:hypothetical protein
MRAWQFSRALPVLTKTSQGPTPAGPLDVILVESTDVPELGRQEVLIPVRGAFNNTCRSDGSIGQAGK